MKKILVFCFCAFVIMGCDSKAFTETMSVLTEVGTSADEIKSDFSSLKGSLKEDNDSYAIKTALINYYDLFLKGDLHKCAEYVHFKYNWSKESFYQGFYTKSKWDNDTIKGHGGIESRDIVILSKSEDGKSARVQVYVKYKDGYTETLSTIDMIKINSRWLKVEK